MEALRIIRTEIATIRLMNECIYIDREQSRYLPASIREYLCEDQESALFSVSIVLSGRSNENTPFRFACELGRWKGFVCYRMEVGFCFVPLDSKCYFVQVEDDFSMVAIHVEDEQTECSRTLLEILHYVYQVQLLKKKKILVHAAAVIYNGECVAFSGDSGAGKSTQANLWKKYLGSDILNYDKPGMTVTSSPYVFGTPFGGKEGICKKGVYPLKGIVFVNQAKENRIGMLSKAQAFSKLYAYYRLFMLDEQTAAAYEEVIAEIAAAVPVYDLYCEISTKAVECTLSVLFGDDLKKKERVPLKVKGNYILRNIAGEYVAYPRGASALDANVTILLNESSAFLWKCLEKGSNREELVDALLGEYAVDRELAERDVEAFLESLEENEVLEKGDEA